MRIRIPDGIIELARQHPEKKKEIYGAAVAYVLDGEMIYSGLAEYLDTNLRRSKNMKGKQNRLGHTKNKTGTDLNLRVGQSINKSGTVLKKGLGHTKKNKSKTTKNQISDDTFAIYISNNKLLYDIVYRYIDNNIQYGSISYQINKQGKEKYIYSQMKESEKIIKQIGFKDFADMLNFISNDEFRSKNILSIAKLNKRNKDGVPYHIVIKDKMKPQMIKNQERERQIELHRQKIREQIESFKSEIKENEQTGLQNGGYNWRENIKLSDIPG